LRGNSKAVFVLAAAASIAAGSSASAHRQDEYLQAARIGIEPNRVELQLDLTPGIAIADAVIDEIDGNRDGVLSVPEQQAYAGRIGGALELAVDGRRLALHPMLSTFPDAGAFRRGEGTIQLRSEIAVPAASDGNHSMTFRNSYRRDTGAYLSNALVPATDRVVVTAQTRDADQRELRIDYVVRGSRPASPPIWMFGVLGAVVIVAARLTRPLLT
jgi:hypothetical protein